MKRSGLSLEAIFKQFNTSGTGSLEHLETVAMLRALVPDAVQADVLHFKVSCTVLTAFYIVCGSSELLVSD